ncbi:MAG: Fic family protein [Bdellovibrionales bacterium]|nr:Fic family protein [Bdellovibrionales bacterium]
MAKSESELLMAINSRLRNFESVGYRSSEVFCEDKSGTSFSYIPFKKISPMMEISLASFKFNIEKAKSRKEIAKACGMFWMNFISIHPFEDANGRTGIEYIRASLRSTDYELIEPYFFKSYKMGIRTAEEDFDHLSHLFLLSIKPL